MNETSPNCSALSVEPNVTKSITQQGIKHVLLTLKSKVQFSHPHAL